MKNLLTNLIKSLKNKTEDEVPYGWFTKEEIAKEMDISIGQVKHYILIAVRDKKIITKRFKKVLPSGALRPVTHYRNK
jgi:transcription initiation factor IIE alpha subunit